MTVAGGQRELQAQAPTVTGRGGCNLDPLRTDGPDALQPTDIPEILKIRLTEIEITWDDTFHHIEVVKADDLFEWAKADRPRATLIPRSGRITRAVIVVQFSDSPRPVTVQMSAGEPPVLPAGTGTEFLKRWLVQSGFCE